MTISRSPNGATHDNVVDKTKPFKTRLTRSNLEYLASVAEANNITASKAINEILRAVQQGPQGTLNDKLLQSKKQVQTIIQEKQAHA